MSTMTWDLTAAAVRPVPALRLTRRGRLAMSVVAILLSGGVALGAGNAVAQSPSAPVAVRAVTVASGQTLWELAGSVAEPGQDVREVVARLVALNGLDSATLVTGQRLLLPAGD
ncbi:LysM peptidoglycan-binding domain-containing protein [Actinotalea sp.]|uniref:LysM peptidoglycan-binding domain-containing protein n=1 Tax=Actinotalea sp. TaxID=1872145 RepID=UPI003564F58A